MKNQQNELSFAALDRWHKKVFFCSSAPLIVIALLSLGVALPADANPPASEPSYGLTVAWLLSKQEELGGEAESDMGGSFSEQYTEFTVQDCVLSWHVSTHHYGEKEEWTGNYAYSIPMLSSIRSLNYVGQKNGVGGVVLESRTQSIKFPVLSTDSPAVQFLDKAYLNFAQPNSDHADIAERFSKALNHLAELCGRERPKAKEVF